MVLKDLTDLYCWVRKNNQHTPDDVLDFMYNAAVEKFTSTNTQSAAIAQIAAELEQGARIANIGGVPSAEQLQTWARQLRAL